jgi:RND superfamily putative drug exporter
MQNWTEKLARTCARRPWVTVGIWVVAIAAAVMAMNLFLSDALVTEVRSTNDPESQVALDLMNSRLGQTEDTTLDEVIIVRSATYTVDDPQFANVVNGLYADLTALGPDVVLGGATYYMTQDPSMVSADRHSAMLAFTMPENGDKQVPAVYAAGDAYANNDFEVFYTGSASWMADSMELGESTMARGETIGIGAALIILALVFGAVAAAVLPIGLGGVAIIVALGLTAVVGTAMDLTFTVTNMITMMGLAVGIDYSLFILTRFREERSKGLSKLDAIGRTGATANRAVFFSGLTVILALSGLVLFPLSIFISMGIGSILVVIAAILASMTLLPAMISLLGDKVNAIRIPFIMKKQQVHTYESDHGFWARMTRVVTKVPALSLIIAVGILLAAAVPFLDKESGMSGISTMPDYLRAKQGYQVMQEEFHVGLDAPAMIVVDGDVADPAVLAGVNSLQASLAGDASFAGSYFQPYPDKNLGVLYASLSGDSMSRVTMDSVEKVRADYIPAAFGGTDADVMVTGETAFMVDFNQTTSDYTPWIFAFVLGLSFIILLLAFRSVVISTTAIVMNLLSVAAAYGLIVLVFQKGIGAGFFGFIQVDAIETWLPLFLFALLFGLSMDYHVFLLSRVRERFQQTGNNAEAVSFGLRSTGRLITGAALIMVAVFGGFALGDLVMMQQMGFGLAVAVLLDATLVRCVLVPATMKLLGNANWYLPSWLRWLPDISLGEHETVTVPARAPKPARVPAGLQAIPVPADDE